MSVRQQRAGRDSRRAALGTPARFPQIVAFILNWIDATHVEIGLADVLAVSMTDLIVQENPTLAYYDADNSAMETATVAWNGLDNVLALTLAAPIASGGAIILQPYATAVRATRGALLAPAILVRP